MGRIVEKENWRVEVYPVDRVYGFRVNEGQEEKICNELVKQIKKHCDEVGSAAVVHESFPRCSFCKSVWTEKTVHNGGCCDEDAKLMPPEPEEPNQTRESDTANG